MSLDINFDNVVYCARSFSLFNKGMKKIGLRVQELNLKVFMAWSCGYDKDYFLKSNMDWKCEVKFVISLSKVKY